MELESKKFEGRGAIGFKYLLQISKLNCLINNLINVDVDLVLFACYASF
jgi:hypothetical protein